MKTHHYIVNGRVQGVFFRYHTKEVAQKLHIKGTVKNLFNGDVEIYAQGETGNITEFETFLHRGSPTSRVDSVKKEEFEEIEIYASFEIIY